MACKRSAVRSRLPPPHKICKAVRERVCGRSGSPSSRGLGHHPFTVSTGVRIPLGTPRKTRVRVLLGSPTPQRQDARPARAENLAKILKNKERMARAASEECVLQRVQSVCMSDLDDTVSERIIAKEQPARTSSFTIRPTRCRRSSWR